MKYLNEKKIAHSKVSSINYDELKIQEYMTSPLFFNQEMILLFALRSRAIDCKINFKSKYKNDDLQCSLCCEEQDDQQHILRCKVLNAQLDGEEVMSGQVNYDDIFGDVHKQKVVVNLFTRLLDIRKTQQDTPDQNISDQMLKNSYNLHHCIVNSSSGN